MTLPAVRNLSPSEEGNTEVTTLLARTPHLRLEHLVSHGQPSPPDFWYDQPEEEWVVLLRGSATLVFDQGSEGDPNPENLELQAGDSLMIPARQRHRVERVSQDAVWLALHFRESASARGESE